MKKLLFYAAVLVVLALGLLQTVQAQSPAPSCYGEDIPAPPVQHQTVLLVDLTTEQDAKAFRDFRAAALTVARQSGQRLVVLSFAGIAPGEMLARELDLSIESPISDEEVINNARIGPFRRSQKCVAQRLAKAPALVQAALDKLQGPGAKGQLARSEIVFAMRQSIADFARPGTSTNFLIYSDGLQNGSGMSFYRDGAVRPIDAAVEGRLLERLGQDRPLTDGGAYRALWWGLLAQPENAKQGTARYFNANVLARLAGFWSHALAGWGAKKVDIGPTLNNPDFRFLPVAPEKGMTP